MQPYIPGSESTTLHKSSAKRGLNMGQAYSGPNYLDGGTVASFADPQITTNNVYMNQNIGQNMMTNVTGQTVKATRQADKAIIDQSDIDEKAQVHARLYKANVLEHPNIKSAATRKLADPQTLKQTMGDVAISHAQAQRIV